MPEPTEQTQAKPPLDQRVRQALDALDTAFTNLTQDGGALSEAELADVEMQAAAAAEGGADAAGDMEELVVADEPIDPEPSEPPEAADEDEVVTEASEDEEFAPVLGEDIDALLAAAEEVVEETAFDAAALEEAEPAATLEEPGSETDLVVDAVEDEVEEPVVRAAEDEETASAIEREISSVVAEEAEEEPASIEELDDELASLAESFVEGDFEDADGQLDEAEIPQVTRVEAVEGAAEEAASEPEADPAVAAEPAADEADASVAAEAVGEASSAGPAKAGKRRSWRGVLAPVGARVLLLISKPTAGLPASTRDTIGWLGLYTGFLAMCVWGFVLLFRKPIAPEPTAEAVNITGTASASSATE